MAPDAIFQHRTQAALCLAALALTPSVGWTQSVRGSLDLSQPTLQTVGQTRGGIAQMTQQVPLSPSVSQAGAVTVQPVYLDAVSDAGVDDGVGQNDLAQPIYASPRLGEGDFPDDAFFTPGSMTDDGRVPTAFSEDPNSALINVEAGNGSLASDSAASTSPSNTTTRTRTPGRAVMVNEDGTEFGLRPNALVFDTASRPFELVGDVGSFGSYEPAWDGSGEQIFLAYPYVDIRLGERIYLSNDRGLGVNLLGTRNAEVSAALDYRLPRRKEDALRAVEEVTGAVTVGGRLDVYIRELGLFVNTDLGVYGDMRGWDVEVGMSSVQPLTERIAMKITGAVSWADKRLLDNKFQVTAEDAAELGVAEYQTEQFGLKDMRVKGELKLFLTDHFGLYGSSEVKVLLEQAAASPLVAELGEAVQFSTNLGLIYRF